MLNNQLILLSLLRTAPGLVGLIAFFVFLITKNPPVDGWAWGRFGIAVVAYMPVVYFEQKRLERRRRWWLTLLRHRREKHELRRELGYWKRRSG